MSWSVTDPGVIAGFYGKLPARGDFVRAGLPRGFTDPWDAWLGAVIAGSRGLMGNDWLPAYLESPVWRFALRAGLCGARPVLGLMLPSVDKAGRYFPLTFAALCEAYPGCDDWLDRCEDAGRTALERDIPPDAISDMIGQPSPASARKSDHLQGPSGDSVWWTDGSPRVQASRLALTGMPDAATYASMLGAWADAESVPPENGPGNEASWEPPS